MNYLVALIVNDPEDCPAILDAWEDVGVTGVTIINSAGLGRLRRAALQDQFPLMPSLSDLFESDEVYNRTLFTVVSSEEMVDRLVEATQKITGDLDKPHSGFMFVLPIARVYGLGQSRRG